MSASAGSGGPLGPLSVGNVVSAGMRIYRSHLQQYFMLALTGYLWIFVPIYGWAKFSAIAGLMARLAFSELINKPETVQEARRRTNPRMWSFLGAGILVGLIFFGLYFGMVITFVILLGVSTALALVNPLFAALGGLLVFVAFLFFIILMIRVLSRLLIVEVPLAVEQNVSASGAIGRSWSLTKESVSRIQWIVVIAFLVTSVVYIPVQVVSTLLQLAMEGTEAGAIQIVLFLLLMALSIVSGALVMPFWQVIKAVIYYDLRARREGLGLELRR